MKPIATPYLQLLDKDQMSFIHKNSLKILSGTGIKVDSSVGLQYFSRIPEIKTEDEYVYIPPDIVDWALKSAPSSISLFSRTGEQMFHLDPGKEENTVFGIGVTNTHFQDFETGDVIPFRREHSIISAQLGDFLSEFDTISTIGVPTDLSTETADLYTTLDLYANTRKPLVILLANDKTIPLVYDLIVRLNSNLENKPSILTYVNPVTPLIINDSTVQKMVHSIQIGCPVVYSNYSMSGATTPASAVGTLSLLNAELLAGLVLGQIIKEGAPMILGSLPAMFDMVTMGSVFRMDTFLLNLACAEMIEYYKLPHCGTSGSGGGRGADLPACDMQWINHLTSCLGKVGLAPFVGGSFDSLVFSPAMVIHANQIIRQIREFRKGIEMDDFAESYDEIKTVRAGGNFLTSEQTLRKIGESSMQKEIWQSMGVENWEQLGKPDAMDQLKEYVREVMSKLEPPDDQGEIMSKGEEIIKELLK